MPSIVPGYEYDIFISYRQKDNKRDGWVTEFINTLKDEIEATFKEDISIYFDENPHDGLHEHHEVDDSLKEKLKCLIFIPIVSQTYCDPKCFAWEHEFKVFVEQADNDQFGLKTKLSGGNVASRVLPVKIHDLDSEDIQLFESEIDGVMRSIDFIYKDTGVNRPLTPKDEREINIHKTIYRDQINKVANAIKDIIAGIKTAGATEESDSDETEKPQPKKIQLTSEINRRNVIRTSLVYILTSLVIWKVAGVVGLPENIQGLIPLVLVVLFPISILMAWLYERSPQGFIRTGSTASRANPFTNAQKKPLTSNTFILLLVVTVVALFLIYPQSSTQQVVSEEIDKSIAVIPFTNMSDDKEQQYFADGVMEDILTQLQRMGELRVTSRTSVEQYRNTTKDAPEIGAELKVSYLLEGSVRKAGNQIMITAQLIDASADQHLWANSFTSEYTTKGLFDIQRKIAENIVAELKLKIVPQKVTLITQAQTENMEAYEHFQKGRQLYSQYSLTSNELGIEQLVLAIQKDPKYAAAYGGLANAFMQRWFQYSYPRNWFDSAKAYANIGLELDNQCVECYKALGLTSQMEGRVKEALKYYEKTLSINPNFISALSNLAAWSLIVGDFKGSMEALKKMLAIDRDQAIYDIGNMQRKIGNYEIAQMHLEKNLELYKTFWDLTSINNVYLKLMNVEKYLETSESIFELSRDSVVLKRAKAISLWMMGRYQDVTDYYELNEESIRQMMAYVADSYLKTGKIQESKIICEQRIDNIFEGYDNNPLVIEDNGVMAQLALYYALSGQKEEALTWMEKAIDNGVLEPFSESFYDNIKDHPRFKELVAKQKKKKEEVMALVASYNFPRPEDL